MKAECKKLILRRETPILCLIAIFLLFAIVMQGKTDSSVLKKTYRTLISEYNMPYTEAVDGLRKELLALGDMPTDNESEGYYRYVAITNLIASADNYAAHNDEMIATLNNLQVKIQNAPTEYIRKDFEKAYNAYNRGYAFHVCNTADVQLGLLNLEDVALIYLYLLFIMAFFCNLFAMERESGMYRLLFACKAGKSGLFMRKITAALVCICVISLLFTILSWVGIWLRRGLSFTLLDEPLQCMDSFSLCPFSLTVGQYLLVSFAMHIIVGLFVLGIISLCSVFLKKSVQVFGVTAMVIFTSAIIATSDEIAPNITHTARKFGGCGLLNLQKYLVAYHTMNVVGKPVTSLYLAIGFTLAVSVTLLLLAYILYTHQPRKGGRICR